METDMTFDEVIATVTARGFDGYGSVRLYCEYGPDSVYAGQIGAVKSEYMARKAREDGAARFYSVSRSSVPIRRA